MNHVKKLRSRTFQNVREAMPRWSEFKEIIQKHPESMVYSALIPPTLTMFTHNLAKSPDQAKLWFAGLAMSTVSWIGAFAREEMPLSKSDNITSKVIATTGFVIGTATILTGATTLGSEIGMLGALGAFFYKPIRDAVENFLHKK